MSVSRYESDDYMVTTPDGPYVLHTDYAALEAENARLTKLCAGLERERDAYRAVLDGAEFRLVDDFQKQGMHFARTLGAHTAAITKRVIAERDALQAKLDEISQGLGVLPADIVDAVRQLYGKFRNAGAELAAAEEALRQCSIAFDLLCKAKDEDRDSFGWAWDEAWEKTEEVQAILAGHAPATAQQATLARSGELWVGPEEEEG